MKSSEQTNEINGALAKAQGAFKPALKNSVNPHFKSAYSDFSSIIEAVREALVANSLSVSQELAGDAKNVSVVTRIGHSSGQWIEFGPFTVPVERPNAHGVGSAGSYAKRYALSAALGVVAENDDDGNEASSRSSQSVAQRIQTPRQEWHPVDGPPPPSDADMPPDVDAIPQQAEGTQRRFRPDGSFVDSPVVPFGRDKGKTLAELDMRSLEWLAGAAKSNINDPTKAKWRSKEQAWLAQVESEIARRQQ